MRERVTYRDASHLKDRERYIERGGPSERRRRWRSGRRRWRRRWRSGRRRRRRAENTNHILSLGNHLQCRCLDSEEEEEAGRERLGNLARAGKYGDGGTVGERRWTWFRELGMGRNEGGGEGLRGVVVELC